MPTLDELDKRKRQKTLLQSIKDLKAVMNPDERLKRVKAISEAKWQQAEEKDNAEELADTDQ